MERKKTFDEVIRAARKTLDADGRESDPMGSVIFGDDDDDAGFLAEPDDTPIPPPRELSKAEKLALDTEIAANTGFFRMFGEFADDELNQDYRMSPELRKRLEEIEREEQEKILGPAREHQAHVDAMIDERIIRRLAESASIFRLGGRSGPKLQRAADNFMRTVGSRAREFFTDGEDPITDAAVEFLQAYIEEDTARMRKVARQLAAA